MQPRDSELTRRREGAKDLEEIASVVIDVGLRIHRELGPGLLESAYEAIYAAALSRAGLAVKRQVPVPISFEDLVIDEGFRLDLLIEDQLIIELKSVEKLAPVHPKQLLTYLKLMDLPLGLLINFGAPLFKNGLKRIVNNHHSTAGSNLRIHQQ